MGAVSAPNKPELQALRRTVVRGLHSMIDESGAFRASIKAIYYLIWVRDSGFSFAYHAAAGWPHKLREMCKFMLSNTTKARGAGVPEGQMFAQLINTDYGKYEEDGAYYAVWSVFNHWTQTDSREFLDDGSLDTLCTAVEWLERRAFDPERGLFGEYTADETPAFGARDCGWDYAIGKPLNNNHGIRYNEHNVVRSYDTYINLIMHSTYTMLAAMCDDEISARYTAKAADLWQHLAPFFDHSRRGDNGLPIYGELVLENGDIVDAHNVPCGQQVLHWGLAMPNFAPLADWDDIRNQQLQFMTDEPRMHFINGLCAAAAAVDTWTGNEPTVQNLIDGVVDEAMRPGPYLPMGGAMPEKFDAPQGNLYHDIRPQGFAMGAWLGALSSLGVRRLPYGLALRPTTAYDSLDAYQWRGKTIDCCFTYQGRQPALKVNGKLIEGTLQIPENMLNTEHNRVEITEGAAGPLLLRSTVQLDSVTNNCYNCTTFGLSELVFSSPVLATIADSEGQPITSTNENAGDLTIIRFTHRGAISVSL